MKKTYLLVGILSLGLGILTLVGCPGKSNSPSSPSSPDNSSVPTSTPLPTVTATSTLTQTPLPTHTSTPTNTATSTPTVTSTSTVTATATVTSTTTDVLTPCAPVACGTHANQGDPIPTPNNGSTNGDDTFALPVTFAATVNVNGFEVSLWGAAQTITVGVYADNSGYPGNLIYASSPEVVSGTGWTMVDSSHYVLCAGHYWICMSGDGNSSDFNTVDLNQNTSGYGSGIGCDFCTTFPPLGGIQGYATTTLPVMRIDYCN